MQQRNGTVWSFKLEKQDKRKEETKKKKTKKKKTKKKKKSKRGVLISTKERKGTEARDGRIRTVDLDLVHHLELHTVLCDKRSNLHVRLWFLRAKLVARKSDDVQT